VRISRGVAARAVGGLVVGGQSWGMLANISFTYMSLTPTRMTAMV
jgi:hypothetical protein